MFKYIWFITIGGTLWCKTINIRGIILVGFSLHGKHGKENPNKWWSLSCKASDYRGLGGWHACFFFGIEFLGSRVREYKACLRLLKIWHGHGLQKTCIIKPSQKTDVDTLWLNTWSLWITTVWALPPMLQWTSSVTRTRILSTLGRESSSWVIWEPMLVWRLVSGELVHSLINLTLHLITCKFISHVP